MAGNERIEVSNPPWSLIHLYIPFFFKDNGPSTPWVFKLLLTFSAITRWGQQMMASYYKHARNHDFGYTYARLPGSCLDHLSKESWDSGFMTGMTSDGYPKFAKMRHMAVNKFGQGSWDKNGAMMERMGDVTFQAYLERKGHPDWRPPCSQIP